MAFELSVSAPGADYAAPVLDVIDRALEEDLGGGDLTSAAVVPEHSRAAGRIEQREAGVVWGLAVAEAVYERIDPSLRWQAHAADGEAGAPRPVAEVTGAARSVLAGERVALNFLQRLSGVATLTARYVRAVEGTGAQILHTRKTTPGLRALEREAVLGGGGHGHRTGLFDAILVKENHSALAGGVGAATRAALSAAPEGVWVEVECTSLAEVDEALDAGAGLILLDNMELAEMGEAVGRAAGRALCEASGGITLDGVRDVAETGVERISVGALTHSAPALDLGLLVNPL